MIEKTIHYCWFGDNPVPPLAQACLNTWKKNCPDYKVVLWNESNSDLSSELVKKALKQKRWAFVSDAVRLDALYSHGGVYLDTDMEIIRNIDHLLTKYDFFVGRESKSWINAGIIGCTKNHPLIDACRRKLHENFRDTGLFVEIPKAITPVLSDVTTARTLIADPEVFYPYNPYDPDRPVRQLLYANITDRTLAIHHWQKSWRPTLLQRVKAKIRRLRLIHRNR